MTRRLVPKILGVSLVLLFAPLKEEALASQSQIPELFFDDHFSLNQQRLLTKDIETLEQFDPTKQAQKRTLSVLEIEALNGRKLSNWFKERVQVLVSDGPVSVKDNAKGNQGLMSNLGVALYKNSKNSNSLDFFTFQSNGEKYEVPLSSPRAGIVSVNKRAFSRKLMIDPSGPSRPPNQFFRLSLLLHEARHSDGHGKSLGFYHSKCPTSHDYQGLKACDHTLNGAYSVSAQVLKEFYRNCQNCTEAEKEELKLRILDFQNRILREKQVLNLKRFQKEKPRDYKKYLQAKKQLDQTKKELKKLAMAADRSSESNQMTLLIRASRLELHIERFEKKYRETVKAKRWATSPEGQRLPILRSKSSGTEDFSQAPRTK